MNPEEAAELIRVRQRDGKIRKLVEDRNSVLHYLSQRRFRVSRLYVVGEADDDKLNDIRAKVRACCRPD